MLEQIPNFPQSFMDRHMRWHTMTPPDGRTIPQGQPGSGAEFLDFHHQFVADVKTWYGSQPGADPSKLAAWAQFPADLAAAHDPELANYAAYASDASNFTTEDALGIYVEAEHNNVHGYIADLYGQPEFNSFDSCMYFMFYQWHGLIDAWRGNWLVHHKSAVKDVLDSHKPVIDKAAFKEVRDKGLKELLPDFNPKHIIDSIGAKQQPETPPKSPKETVEGQPPVFRGDQVEALAHRLAQLETVVHRQAFIRAKERPAVG